MTEPMIEENEAEVEVFADELSDEALDRVKESAKGSTSCPPRCRESERC